MPSVGQPHKCLGTVLFLWLMLIAPTRAQDDGLDDYIGALRLLAMHRDSEGIATLETLVRTHPDRLAPHRALVLSAVGTSRAPAIDSAMQIRLLRNPKDSGAAFARALLLEGQGNRAEAHRLLLSALVAGSRDPLLVDPLLRTAADSDRLVVWLRGEAARVPEDAPFWALVVRLTARHGQLHLASNDLDAALARHPDNLDLLTLAATLRRAAGAEREACAQATLAAGYLTNDRAPPEVRVPRRLELARTFIDCGRLDAARQMIAAVGPTWSPPGTTPLSTWIALVEADLSIASEDPLGGFVALQDLDPLVATEPAAREYLMALRAGAFAALGVDDHTDDDWLATELPRGLLLVDRARALAARMSVEGALATDGARYGAEVASALETAGLPVRAARLWLLAAARETGGFEAARVHLGQALVLTPEESASPSLRTATRLVRARLFAAQGGHLDALSAARSEPLRLAGAPAALLAPLRLVAGRSALVLGRPGDALALARDGLLDVQEADRSREVLPFEFAPLAGDLSDQAVLLSALALRAGRAAGQGDEATTSTFLRDLGRSVRRWSLLEAPWPSTASELQRQVPRSSCLVIATPGAEGVAVVATSRTVTVVPTLRALDTAECRDLKTIYWAGPAAAPGGLTARSDDPRLLVRLVCPAPLPEGPLGEPANLRPAWPNPVGNGPQRAYRRAVESLIGLSSDAAATTPPQTVSDSSRRSVGSQLTQFEGFGLAPSRTPLAAGWLVPPVAGLREGWLGPATTSGLLGDPHSGVFVTGLRRLDTSDGNDKGRWVLAESLLGAGWRWGLLADRPLTTAQRSALSEGEARWIEDPLREARRLSRADGDLAARLSLWSATGRIVKLRSTTALDTLFYLPIAAAVLLAFSTIARLIARHRARQKRAARSTTG